MDNFVELLRIFILNHRSLEYIIIFGGALFGGELALFTFGFFTAQGVLPIFSVILLSFLATYPPNILWFILGKTSTMEKIISHRYTNTTISMITEAIRKMSRGSHFVSLFFIKFLVGTPFMLMMYANKTQMRFGEFIVYETPAVLLSLAMLIPIGFLSGLGFSYLADLFNSLFAGLGFLLLVVVFVVSVQLWLKKIFTSTKGLNL